MKMLTFIFATVFAYQQNSFAIGTGTSNGGDNIRATFISMGQEILTFLEKEDAGKKILNENKIIVSKLNVTLDIQKIQVIEGPLVDDTGSIVDSHGIPGLIRLDQSRWNKLLGGKNDIYYLVFHEMLRSAEYNDDGYVISLSLNPFRKTPSISKSNPIINDNIYTMASNPWSCALQARHFPADGFMSVTTVSNPVNGYYCDELSRKTVSYRCKENFCWRPATEQSFDVIEVMPSGSFVTKYHRCYLGDKPDNSKCHVDNPQLFVNSGLNDEGIPSVFDGQAITKKHWTELTVDEQKQSIEKATQQANFRCQAYRKTCKVDPSSIVAGLNFVKLRVIGI